MPRSSSLTLPRSRRARLGARPRSTQPSPAAFRAVQAAVEEYMREGRGLTAVEDQLIDPSLFGDELKTALWLLAWSLLPSSYQVTEVEAHIERLLALPCR